MFARAVVGLASLLILSSALGAAAAALPHGSAPSPIYGKATSCTNFYTCSYTLSNATGNGSAMTSGMITFRLPGEANATKGTAISYSPVGTTGTTHWIRGTFTDADTSSGKIVAGDTNVNVTATSHCYRAGCYYTYSFVNGTIVVQPTTSDGTVTSAACSPSSLKAQHSTLCTITVTDIRSAAIHPTGNVTIKTYLTGIGHFKNKGICALANGTCKLKWTGSDEFVGTASMTASYPGVSGIYWMTTGTTYVYVS